MRDGIGFVVWCVVVVTITFVLVGVTNIMGQLNDVNVQLDRFEQQLEDLSATTTTMSEVVCDANGTCLIPPATLEGGD